ncbi:hypothetical protein AO943_36460 [Pseudomonas aeruginosa]|nr:hypothetical protein AO943_36460 [Pseudomonas aeruginosa]HBP6575629.1 hypothetical protein [Pseudomonas aeruginosa]HBP6576337.1 hypothetical protein [Pseudomonas aeruginosa]
MAYPLCFRRYTVAMPGHPGMRARATPATVAAERNAVFPTARAEHRSPERSQDFMTDGPLERLPGKTSDKNDT